jgi:hypothetical protein
MKYLDLSFLQQYLGRIQATKACKQSAKSAAAQTQPQAGFYELLAGRALDLRATEPSMLRVGRGGLWLTSSRCPGDHFLSPGQQWQVERGERIVIEPWQTPAGQSARFAWDAVLTKAQAQIQMAGQSQIAGQSQATIASLCTLVAHRKPEYAI